MNVTVGAGDFDAMMADLEAKNPQMQAFLAQAEKADQEQQADPAEVAEAAEKAEEPAPEPAKASEAKDDGQQPEKRGSVIPLDRHQAVLDRQREQAQQQLQTLQAGSDAKISALEQRLASIEAQQQGGEQVPKAAQVAADAVSDQEFEEAIAEMHDILPAKLAKVQEQLARQQRDTVRALQAQKDQAAQLELKTEQDRGRADIAQVPVLRQWINAGSVAKPGTTEHSLYRAVGEFDATLERSPAWAGKPQIDRFREAVRLTASAHGIDASTLDLGAAQQDLTPKPKPKPLPTDTQRPLGPSSLSNIPSGASPETSSDSVVESYSYFDTINATKGMSRQQAEAFLLHGGRSPR